MRPDNDPLAEAMCVLMGAAIGVLAVLAFIPALLRAAFGG